MILGGSQYSTEWKLTDDQMAGVASENGDIILSVFCPNDSYGIIIDFPNDTPVGNWINIRWGDQEYINRYNLYNDGEVMTTWDKGPTPFDRHGTSPRLRALMGSLERHKTMEIYVDVEQRVLFYDTVNLDGAAGVINRLECV